MRGAAFEILPESPDTLTAPATWESLPFAPLDTLETPLLPPDILAEPDST